ncbi:MAG: chorismate-binding protein [Chryseolinea sp.]
MQQEKISTSTLFNISEGKCLSFLIQWAFDNQYAVAVWRLPFAPSHHIVLSRKEALLQPDASLEDLPKGFVIAPFDSSRDRLYLKADLAFTFTNGLLASSQNNLETTSIAWLSSQPLETFEHLPSYYAATELKQKTSKEYYLRLVENSIEEISKGTFEKVVPSRTEHVELDPSFDIVSAFHRLCELNPNALVSFVSSPTTGSWLGATPEILVEVENRRIFKTVALAGTQPYRGQLLKDVAWTQKDIEEQALVERYIISCFKRIRLREYDEHGPRTVVAGHLLHLKSEFKVDMLETNFPQLGTVMLSLLHPTAAVCGTPLQAARHFLAAHEGYDRQYYSGYLGPVNFDDGIHIFVNLRCAQLFSREAILYAGAGVTIDSVPAEELAETEIKLNTLRNILMGSGHGLQ